MNKLFAVASLLIVLAAWSHSADAQGEKPLTAKEIMGKLNKGDKALCPTIGKELRAEEPAWDQIQQDAKNFTTYAEALSKARAPKGEMESWEKLTKAYAGDAKALEEAAGKRDKKAAQTALARLADMKTCGACHSAHRTAGP
jgi:hypothetical protein